MTSVLPNRAAADTGLALFDHASPAMTDYFHEHGFALLRNALSAEEVAEINAEALRLCRGDLGEIRYGWWDQDQDQDGTAAPEAESDEDVLRRFLCIHYPHKVSAAAKK
ncbi:MAG: phytanoyl-CoA hydroxylase, partial [Propionibacteriaceae bacterium]|nr:phytanoyl-CoA hydroxylase [Propionibacteriaceae bacterium]